MYRVNSYEKLQEGKHKVSITLGSKASSVINLLKSVPLDAKLCTLVLATKELQIEIDMRDEESRCNLFFNEDKV